MQSTNTTPVSQLPHQHSPKRASPLSTALPLSCDTPSTPPPPATPHASHAAPQNPLTPPDSASRAAAAAAPDASAVPASPLPALALASAGTAAGSTLSVSAPQFHSRLDAPIDIHQLAPRTDPVTGAASASATSSPATSEISPRPAPAPGPTQGQAQGTDAHAPSQLHTVVSPSPAARELASSFSPSQKPASAQSQAQAQAQDLRTPNVYINGLPPNFPEDHLYAMTREFGTVLSVRTFTRHVSDKPSGYGFVLFEDVDAAEKCIETLRKYRNLHPSFSKQIHKIPGTPYASASGTSGETASRPADSFKARMEQLQDTTSTNLYMEGLPLSIDEPTLAALVRPYKIMSSRFFQTRLSNPPRIIAFVRLETRTAAEEVIERLHGRMVRGWQDAGCRISVRFADTSEQRELRRMERCTHEGEPSPGRLTMAQAALLNLKGTQIQPDAPHSPQFGFIPDGGAGSPLVPDSFSLARTGGIGDSLPPISRTADALQFQQRQQLYGQTAFDDPAMALDSYEDLSSNAVYLGQGLGASPQDMVYDAFSLQDAQAQLQLAMELERSGVSTHAENGFTAIERLLVQAHIQRQQAQLLDAQRERLAAQTRSRAVSNSVAASSPATRIAPNVDGGAKGRRLLDVLPSMSEDDFHASAAGARRAFAGFTPPGEAGPGRNTLSRVSAEQASGLALGFEQLSLSQQSRQRYQTHAAQATADAEAQALHTRSTTLPSRYLSNRDSFQNSIGRSAYSNNPSIISTNNDHTTSNTNINPSSNSTSFPSKHAQYTNTVTNALRTSTNAGISSIAHSNSINSLASQSMNSLFSSKNNINIRSTRISTNAAKAGTIPSRHSQDADDEDDGSPLLSPALTYSARTPASMSPSTPFSGFFPNTGETFEGTEADIGGKGVREGIVEDKSSVRAGNQ